MILKYVPYMILFIAIPLTLVGCGLNIVGPATILKRASISDFTLNEGYIYFGAGYRLFRLNVVDGSAEIVFETDRLRVERPLVADGIVYFGGRSFADSAGKVGERTDKFLAFDLKSRRVIWEYSLVESDSYGTSGTLPQLGGDYILVSSRRAIHCLDRASGKRRWTFENWMGVASDEVVAPYVFDEKIFVPLNVPSHDAGRRTDQKWGVVDVVTGELNSTFAEIKRSTYSPAIGGTGFGVADQGVIFTATRYADYPNSNFGAIDLKEKRVLWEIPAGSSRNAPAINNSLVFTTDRNNGVVALNRSSGEIVWTKLINTVQPRPGSSHFETFWSKRLVATDRVLIFRDSVSITALETRNGNQIWTKGLESGLDDENANPLIIDDSVIVTSAKECSIVAFNLSSGKELWKTSLPDCHFYVVIDD